MPLPASPSTTLSFDDYKLDLCAGELYKAGRKIRLQDQPFRMLAILLENPGQVVTREQLRDRLWPQDTFVDFDHSLNTAVKKLRRALNDEADKPRYIETLPKRGYRFIGWVVDLQEAAVASDSTGVASPPAEKAEKPKPTAAVPTVITIYPLLRRNVLLAVAILVVVCALAGYLHRRPPLTEKDTIVLADFENGTGDAVFDGTLKQALSVQLQQSPFLNLVPDQQLRETLRSMEHSREEHIVGGIAHEVCLRQNAKAVLQGSIKRLGSHYVLGLNASNCQTDALLAEEQEEVRSKEEVLAALGGMASRLRGRLGESLASVKQYDTPVRDATTSSLDALKAYSLGVSEIEKGNSSGAIPFLDRAIELDPNFALAYMSLYIADWDIGEYEAGRAAALKAFTLRQHVSDREKLMITALYHDIVTGDLEKVMEADRLLAKTYPRESIPHLSLATDYSLIGEFDRAREEALLSISVAPYSAIGYGSLAIAYQGLNRWKESRAALEQAAALGGDSQAYTWLFVLAFAEGDEPGEKNYLEAASKKVQPSDRPAFQFNQGEAATFQGKLDMARESVEAAAQAARQMGLKQNEVAFLAQGARWEAQMGNLPRACKLAKFASRKVRGIDVEVNAALALALCGDEQGAERLANALASEYPEDTVLSVVSMPLIRSVIELEHGNPRHVIELLKDSERYELGVGFYYFPALMPAYTRGQAYLKLHDGSKAAAEFQKILDHRGSGPVSLCYAMAYLGLGRAKAIAGDVPGAKGAYQDFLTLWKDADPDIPILKQAKAEYAKLQ